MSSSRKQCFRLDLQKHVFFIDINELKNLSQCVIEASTVNIIKSELSLSVMHDTWDLDQPLTLSLEFCIGKLGVRISVSHFSVEIQ